MPVPAPTIRGMAGDQETASAAAAVTAGGELVPRAGARPTGPVVIAAELLAPTRGVLPVLAGLGEREELLAAAWLASLRAPAPAAPMPATCGGGWGGWGGWPSAGPMCWARAGCTWTCGRPASRRGATHNGTASGVKGLETGDLLVTKAS